MNDYGMSVAEEQEYADRIREARGAARGARRARRAAFWARMSDDLLSIPAGITARLGG